MKTLKAGTLPGPPAPPWPIGCKIICSFCQCEFMAETEADFTSTAERHPGGRYSARLSCPTCDRPGILLREASDFLA